MVEVQATSCFTAVRLPFVALLSLWTPSLAIAAEQLSNVLAPEMSNPAA
jgi:hypothetical protein